MRTFRLHMEFTQQTCDEAAAPPAVEIDDVASRRGFELVGEILGLAPGTRTEYETG